MKTEATICAAAVKNEFNLLVQVGVNPAEITQMTGITPQELVDPDARIPMEVYLRLEEAAPKLTNNPAIGLKLGTEMTSEGSQTGILGYIAAHSPTIREGFQQAIRYSNLLTDASYMALQEMDGQAEFIYMRPDPQYFTIQSIELALSRTATLLQMFGDDNFRLISAYFQYSAPSYISDYQRIFGHELWFNEPENKIVFPASILDQLNSGAHSYLREVLLTRAEELLAGLNEATELEQQIRKAIVNALPSGPVSVDKIANQFGMSRQTLYRHLKEQNTSFQTLLEDTRKGLAANYLRHTEYSLTEISFLLGFAELSSFHRAFKRWYGMNPRQYREK